MTTLTIVPNALTGNVWVPSSKSMGHRALICAALAEGESRVENISLSKDIRATQRCMEALGASFSETAGKDGRVTFTVRGGYPRQRASLMDCGESGSTLRFLIPLAAVDGSCYTFIGQGELGSRPLDPYEVIFRSQGLRFAYGKNSHFPLEIQGPLSGGTFTVPGNVSSQFISGLLFALPLLPDASRLEVTGTFESRSYVALTLSALKAFGIRILEESERVFRIPGGQAYQPCSGPVEGDFSQAAFWLVAGALGKGMLVQGMLPDSLQGDRAILPILGQMGASLVPDQGGIRSHHACLHGTVIDASDCPDLVPVLSVAAALADGHTDIIHAERLRLKECDRLKAMATELNKIGAHIEERPDGLSIDGVSHFTGGTVDSWNDHRVAMSLAVASIGCREKLTLTGAESVAKSYPAFWQDFAAAGGQYEQYNR
jgi:3-phosphoshikimate 1-carboxyvinyltransferase